MQVTHIGTATLLLEIEGLRILTDPALDPAGSKYRIRAGFSTEKSEEPALPPGGLGALDVVLLSHDHHADNLDAAGRAILPGAGVVLTTVPGARRLGGNALGLTPFATHEVGKLRITAVPARHGPPGIELIDSVTIGFVLEWPGQRRGAVYISGDTVYFRGISQIAKRFSVGTAILHLGAAGFPITGPLHYTFTAAEAVRAAVELGRPKILPVHYDGWRHFRAPRADFERAFAEAELDVHWLPRGTPSLFEA